MCLNRWASWFRSPGPAFKPILVDGDWLLAQIARQDVKDALRATVDEAISRGVFGVPTIFLNRDDMYFGVDRLQLVEARLASSRGSSVRSGAGADG